MSEWRVDYSHPEFNSDNYQFPVECSDPECDGCCASDTKPCHRGGCDMCEYGPYPVEYDYPEYDADYAFFEREGRPRFPNEY